MLARAIFALALTALVAIVPDTALRAAPPVAQAAGDVAWQSWNDELFARAKRENKFVLLSLQSWWCPWCHTMNVETYADQEVRAYIDAHFIPVRVDQDNRPDISQRYERWGWPATVLFGPDGTEIVKLRGFYSAEFFLPILQETVKDPTPVDYGDAGGPERERQLATALPDERRAEIVAFLDQSYDQANDGWGKSKLVDGPTLTYAIERARAGDKTMDGRIRRTLARMTALIDKDAGAIGQVTLAPDWSRPSREFPMFAQQAALAAYSEAWVLWRDPAFRAAADRIYAFLRDTMRSPEGGFYASLGHEKGNPGVDKSLYARETAQATLGVLAYYDATGIDEARAMAVKAVDWALKERRLAGGGFRHGPNDIAGPYLADSLYMTDALLALYRSTADRRYLAEARATADYILATFVDEKTGGFVVAARPMTGDLPAAVQQPIKQREDNVATVRVLNALYAYSGDRKYRAAAEAGMGYLASPAIQDAADFLPDVLLTEMELTHEPVHVTIVGAKADQRSAALFRAALAYPTQNKRAEWWDKAEGKLANHDVDYPDYPEPAAFACTSRFCSKPVTDPALLAETLDQLDRKIR